MKNKMSVFKFKQFEVDQTDCAMKINTDGVLIGAIATYDEPKRILDIGTGTGVIALMLAQRFPEAFIDALEIDNLAAQTAGANFKKSVFKDRLRAHHVAMVQYHNDEKYDLIVSNPPFFVNDLKNTEVKKGIARHADEQFFTDLILKVNSLLSKNGKVWLILPPKQADSVVKMASNYQLYLSERINIRSDETRSTFRQIICLNKQACEVKVCDFFIYQSFNVHTQQYKFLLRDFFLAF